jgi:signal transduction histidine kinase
MVPSAHPNGIRRPEEGLGILGPVLRFIRHGWLAWLLLAGAAGAPVEFREARASVAAGGDEALSKTIDGVDASALGWSLGPGNCLLARPPGVHPGAEPLKTQTAIFIPAAPVDARRFEFALYFLSGAADKAMAQFALFVTTDAEPMLNGRWERVQIERASATNCRLEQVSENQLWAVEKPIIAGDPVRDPVYHVTARWPGGSVTGFRLDAIPVVRPNENMLRMSWAADGDFVLTEFHVEALSETNTNIARGTRVTASHLLSGNMPPGNLTDGVPSTYAHPWQPDLGAAFHFEIDLGRVAELDHIALRGRGDNVALDRLSRVRLQLYQESPETGASANWQAVARADGTHPPNGGVDVLHAGSGRGEFRGRYLRISSDSPVPLSPQLAEVEVYEVRTLSLRSVAGDGSPLPVERPLRVPAGTRMLGMDLAIPSVTTREAPFRWRLAGYHDQWQNESSLQFNVACPAAGQYVFEAQTLHSDGVFDSSAFAIPVTVLSPFTQTPLFYTLALTSCLALGWLVMRQVSRRKIARMRAETALLKERGRIARDMHDDVGACLCRLSVLQETFARDYHFPAEARQDLQQLALTARQAVSSLHEVIWTIHPKHDQLDSLVDHLLDYADKYLAPLEIQCRVDAPESWPPVEIRSQVRRNLVLAFKEALQNIAKHANATEVRITMAVEDDALVVTIIDNGIGLAQSTDGTDGDGLDNMRNRLVEIHGSCRVSTGAQGGTEVTFRIPIHHR